MKKTKELYLIEYTSPFLIISYFFIHNIYLVLIGIILSLYLLNLNSINIIIKSINKKLVIKHVSRELNKIDNTINSNSIKIKKTKEDSNLSLVETIEELGFIPSIDKKRDINGL
tara:strand:- start:406 stop:747 length:342 start_codon:yes stop_codon:yes gene_type:complete